MKFVKVYQYNCILYLICFIYKHIKLFIQLNWILIKLDEVNFISICNWIRSLQN